MIERPRVKFVSTVIMLILLAGCGQGSVAGPGDIHWDRQTCEHCQMVISEQRHAVQIRMLGARQTHAFDDLGCALLWLEEQGLRAGGGERPEIWVKGSTASDWIDAHGAQFEAGLSTPMAYGFGVAEHGISLGEVETQVRETERQRRSHSANPVRGLDRGKGESVD
jgi:nitrous oxide reductase accessory protein NosL